MSPMLTVQWDPETKAPWPPETGNLGVSLGWLRKAFSGRSWHSGAFKRQRLREDSACALRSDPDAFNQKLVPQAAAMIGR